MKKPETLFAATVFPETMLLVEESRWIPRLVRLAVFREIVL
jgi:hypothetical protein